MSVSLLFNIRQAFKQNWLPAFFLQGFALSLAYCFYYVPSALFVFNYIAAAKQEAGIYFAIASTALFGGFIPCLYLWLTHKIKQQIVFQFVFYIVVWAILGALVDIFYQQQSIWFGDAVDMQTIAKKAAVDQFIFSALLTCPCLTVAYLWKDCHFNWQQTRTFINRKLFVEKIPTTVITNWLIWFPAVAIIYSMPANIQIPLFNLVLCFFVLLLSMLKRDD